MAQTGSTQLTETYLFHNKMNQKINLNLNIIQQISTIFRDFLDSYEMHI